MKDLKSILLEKKALLGNLKGDSFIEKYEHIVDLGDINAVELGVMQTAYGTQISYFAKSYKIDSDLSEALGLEDEITHLPVRVITDEDFNVGDFTLSEDPTKFTSDAVGYKFTGEVPSLLTLVKVVSDVTSETGNLNEDGTPELKLKYKKGTEILQLELGANSEG